MKIGDPSRIGVAFAEAAIDPTLWGRAPEVATKETSSFGATLLALKCVAIPNVPSTETAGAALEHYFRDICWSLSAMTTFIEQFRKKR